MIELFISIAVYICSIFWMRYETLQFYKGLEYVKPDAGDLFIVFAPFMNTIAAVVYFCERKIKRTGRINKLVNNTVGKFFGGGKQ